MKIVSRKKSKFIIQISPVMLYRDTEKDMFNSDISLQ